MSVPALSWTTWETVRIEHATSVRWTLRRQLSAAAAAVDDDRHADALPFARNAVRVLEQEVGS